MITPVRPKQLKLPLGEPTVRVPAYAWQDMLTRLSRMESRLVALMRHQGMTSDGRSTLHDSHGDQPK